MYFDCNRVQYWKIYILEFIIQIFTNDQRRKDIIKYIYIKQMLHLTSVLESGTGRNVVKWSFITISNRLNKKVIKER